MANQKIIPHYLIPPRTLRRIHISNEEEFIFLGSNNLRACLKYWEGEKRKNTESINDVRDRMNALLGRNIDDIKKLASEYDNPELEVVIGKLGFERRTSDTRATDEDSAKLKPTATTFNVCGWCKYGKQSDYRIGNNDWLLAINCSCLPQTLNDIGGGLHFDTPCLITNGSQELLDVCQNHLRSGLLALLEKEKIINGNIEFIENAIERAEEKPLFPEFRDENWASVGDEIIYITKNLRFWGGLSVFNISKTLSGDYCSGEFIVDIYDDVYHFRYEKLVEPYIMKPQEHEYFKTHPDYLEVWIYASKPAFSNQVPATFVDIAKAYAEKTYESWW